VRHDEFDAAATHTSGEQLMQLDLQPPMETLSPHRLARLSASRSLAWVVLACIVGVMIVATATAMRATSTTFDEIVFISAGARGYATGSFDLAPDHPPLMQYIYGLPAALAGAALPDESGVAADEPRHPGYRYRYASRFFWEAGNDPERAAFLGRIPAVIMAAGLVLVTFFFTRRHWGSHTALLAAALVAFLPDVLAHGGVAYSDLPVTLAIMAAAWAIDETVRSPSWRRGMIAGALTGLALAVKISAAGLAPLAAALVVFEWIGRSRDRRLRHGVGAANWARHLAAAAAVAVVAAYAVLVIVYRGDILLEQFRYGLAYRYMHMTGGHGAPAFLLGDRSATGWWYFFPVAFLFKTSAGLHALLAVSLTMLVRRTRAARTRVFTSGLRVALLAILVFGAVLITSSLNIGFRYAMPLLPWICVIAAVGTTLAWRSSAGFVRAAIVAFTALAIAFPLSYYPNFLSFISEYGPERRRNHTVLVDSSLDWGQGLLALRAFMSDNDIPSVYLSYFGSAEPAGYGIEYVPLASFFRRPPQPALAVAPDWLAISATNLQGVYLPGDPFAGLRGVRPHAVVANTILLYHLPSLEPGP
jgi:hypothetical protein